MNLEDLKFKVYDKRSKCEREVSIINWREGYVCFSDSPKDMADFDEVVVLDIEWKQRFGDKFKKHKQKNENRGMD